MSSGPGGVQPPWRETPYGDLAQHQRRLRALEAAHNARWHYVGGPGETTVFAPPWGNVGGTAVPMRFRLTVGGGLEIQGSIIGGTSGTQITSQLPIGYYPGDYDVTVPAVHDDLSSAGIVVRADGTIWAL